MVLPAISPSFWRPLPPPDSWLLLRAFRGPFVPSTWYTLFSPWSPGFCYIVKWQECISDVSPTKMLSLVPFPFVRGRWLSSLLLQLWARFILVLLCLFCCVTEFLCHPPYLTLVFLVFLHFFLIGGKLLYIVVLVSFSSLPWYAGVVSRWWWLARFSTCGVYTILHRAGAILRVSHLLLRAHLILSDPVKVRPFL